MARPRVLSSRGFLLRTGRARLSVGERVILRGRGRERTGVVVGFDDTGTFIAPVDGTTSGISGAWIVEPTSEPFSIPVGEAFLGRVIDPLGRTLDGAPAPRPSGMAPLEAAPPHPLKRQKIGERLVTGVRVIDGLITMGKGQRMGLFAGSGVGKSTLMAMVAATRCDAVVLCLVGERGREVREFLEDVLPARIRSRSVVVVSTSADPPIMRAYAPLAATAHAEWLADRGRHVLLLVDSVTRYARALREVALSAGELPARRGYPPSVFSSLPSLVERAGPREKGAITAIYTVLVEGGDMDEPITDEIRGLLDGHVILSRTVAQRGIYPAVDVPASVSRLFGAVAGGEHARAASVIRRALAALKESEPARRMGAYAPGADPFLDRAVELEEELWAFVSQRPDESVEWEQTMEAMETLAARLTQGLDPA